MAAKNDVTSCTVCLEIFNDPRCLRCGHSFCLKCIKGVAGNKQTFPCPICRVRVDLRDGKVDELPKNFVLCDVIEAKDMTQPSTCLEHKKLLDIYCEGCDMVICSKCLSTKHKGHVIGDIDKIFMERNDKLSAFLVTTKTWASMIQKKRDFVETSRKSLQENPDSIDKTVESTFKKWYDHLHMQQYTILRKLRQERDKKVQVCDEAQRILKSCTTNVTELETEINIIRSKGTACVVQEFGSARKRQEDTERKILLDMKTCFASPGDSKIEICAPWIEEAIDNITLTDMVQKEAKQQPRKIAMILTENISLKSEKNVLLAEKQNLEAEIRKLKDENKEQKQSYEKSKELKEKENSALLAEKQKKDAEIKSLQDEIKALKQSEEKNKNLNEKLKKLEEQKDDLKQRVTALQKENNEVKYRLKESQNPSLSNVISGNDNKAVQQLKDENERLRTRLSEMEGAQMTLNNPNKAELSDAFRPTKLSEEYSELYDNLWTDAFEEHGGKKEEDIIQILGKTLLGSYKFCEKLCREFTDQLTNSSLSLPNSKPKTGDIPIVYKKQLQDMKKSFGVFLRNDVKEAYRKQNTIEGGKKTKNYIDACVELCWLMVIQEPPVVIETPASKDSAFDSDTYRTYTKIGTKVDFVVWPALRLHQGGPLLTKGVAQGKN